MKPAELFKMCHRKKRYGKDLANRLVEKFASSGKNLKAYLCPNCCGYHLAKNKPRRQSSKWSREIDVHSDLEEKNLIDVVKISEMAMRAAAIEGVLIKGDGDQWYKPSGYGEAKCAVSDASVRAALGVGRLRKIHDCKVVVADTRQIVITKR